MQEKGVVLRTTKKKAIVEVKRKDECASCKACFFGNSDKTAITAVNTANAAKGDHVMVRISNRKNASGYFIVFGIPLVLLLVGALVGSLFDGELFVILGAFLGLALGFLVIYIIDKIISRDASNITEVVEILNKQ